ncbi:MAG: hypothetical protein GWN18_10730 [Thermoplasmata archaeon]|nr:hypothetical protein [Thermoplasmata archaeon]NIS12512.1 hypothetical protein [Thermoplasmata archaeon]NIS20438.1 hypothetical protein [Thermoplasmata archaeon]NIT77784.1 hypothetical protein [Thermoplasmata archaeon]NIU49525.1 hypothetical protein [Thermoplasmata archaeon]
MEAGSAIVLAFVLLAGGGTAGAVMMTDAGDWTGHGMMGNGPGMMGGDYEECPYHDGYGRGECFRGADVDPEECEEHAYEECPYSGDEGYQRGGGGCC